MREFNNLDVAIYLITLIFIVDYMIVFFKYFVSLCKKIRLKENDYVEYNIGGVQKRGKYHPVGCFGFQIIESDGIDPNTNFKLKHHLYLTRKAS